MISFEYLQVMDITITGPVAWIIGYLLWLCPGGNKVVFDYDGPLSFGSQLKCFGESLAGVWCCDRDDIPHAVHSHLLVYSKQEFAGDCVAVKCPVNFAVSEIEHFLLSGDEIGLLVAEVERFAKSEPRHTIFSIIGRYDLVFAKGEFWKHHWQIAIGGPVKHTWTMRKCQYIRRLLVCSIS